MLRTNAATWMLSIGRTLAVLATAVLTVQCTPNPLIQLFNNSGVEISVVSSRGHRCRAMPQLACEFRHGGGTVGTLGEDSLFLTVGEGDASRRYILPQDIAAYDPLWIESRFPVRQVIKLQLQPDWRVFALHASATGPMTVSPAVQRRGFPLLPDRSEGSNLRGPRQ